MLIEFNGRKIPITYKFIENRIRKAFEPYKGRIDYHIDYSRSTHSVYISFTFKGEFYKIRISDHETKMPGVYQILLVDGGQPQIKTKIRRYLQELQQQRKVGKVC